MCPYYPRMRQARQQRDTDSRGQGSCRGQPPTTQQERRSWWLQSGLALSASPGNSTRELMKRSLPFRLRCRTRETLKSRCSLASSKGEQVPALGDEDIELQHKLCKNRISRWAHNTAALDEGVFVAATRGLCSHYHIDLSHFGFLVLYHIRSKRYSFCDWNLLLVCMTTEKYRRLWG